VGALFVSASEIEVFDLCQRKWAFVYIEQKRPPPNESAALGTRVHAILERWLKEGAAPDLITTAEGTRERDAHEIAASGLHLLPPPRTPTLVTEEQFSFTSKRAWYTGFKDFRYRDANGLLHVGDHKTTKAFTWAKTTDEILCHPQALIYSVDEFFKNPNDNVLSLDWVYYKTTGSRKAEPRFQIVAKQTVAEMFFEHVDPVAGEITRLHHEVPAGTSALDFPPDFRACDAFGGCAFLSICNPTPTQRVQATMTQAGLSLADKLKAMKANRAPSPIHPPEAFQAPAAAPPAAPMMQQPVAAPVVPMMQQPVAAPMISVAAPPMQFSLPTPQGAPAGASMPVPQATPMAPMDPALYQVSQGAPPVQAVSGPGMLPHQVPYQPPAAAPPAQPAPAATAVPEPPAEPKKSRGRPKKAPKAQPDDGLADPVDPGIMNDGFTLYVGCAPIGCNVTNTLEYVNAAHDQLKEAHGVTHYREMEFGKGPGMLCAALEVLLALCEGTSSAPSGDVVLGGAQIEEDTASVWFSKATKVVRAFR
jgi:hypothetical protein